MSRTPLFAFDPTTDRIVDAALGAIGRADQAETLDAMMLCGERELRVVMDRPVRRRLIDRTDVRR